MLEHTAALPETPLAALLRGCAVITLHRAVSTEGGVAGALKHHGAVLTTAAISVGLPQHGKKIARAAPRTARCVGASASICSAFVPGRSS
jgi:hypothetical protein